MSQGIGLAECHPPSRYFLGVLLTAGSGELSISGQEKCPGIEDVT